MRGGGWNGESFRRGGVNTPSIFESVSVLVLEKLWLRLFVPEVEVLVLFGSCERRRRRPDTAYETGYVK